jgi:2-methylisocitrate lyase-like PEP mutase family enzyme
MGFSIALYANAALQTMIQSIQEVLGTLKTTGSLDSVQDRMAGFVERQRIVGKPSYDALEARYKGA